MEDTKGLSYFFLGLGIGVAVGVMFAPASGSETRGQIRSKALEGGDYARRRAEEIKESATGLVDKGREVLNKQKDQFSSAVDAGKQAYRDALGQAKSSVNDAIDQAAQGV